MTTPAKRCCQTGSRRKAVERLPDRARSETEPIPQLVRLLNDVAAQVEVVGLGITEHLPWDAIASATCSALPLIGSET